MSTATRLNVGQIMAQQQQMLDQQRLNLGQLCAQGVPGAWQVLTAIYGGGVRVEAGEVR